MTSANMRGKHRPAGRRLLYALLSGLLLFWSSMAQAQQEKDEQNPALSMQMPKFTSIKSGLELERRSQAGTFYDVVGGRSALFGYEHGAAEAWVYPLKLLDDFQLAFQIEGYPQEFPARELLTNITVRPEATIFTYSHAAFTVRQIIYAPVDEPGIIMLLEVKSVLPMTATVSFRPKLKLAWPAGLMTGSLYWDEKLRAYSITEETGRYAGVIGSPAAQDVSVMPYQEEPRDVPVRFRIAASAGAHELEFVPDFIPVVIAGSVGGRARAIETYQHLLSHARELYELNVGHYEQLLKERTSIRTPDERLNTAFEWAKVGIDKGLGVNPFLGRGLLAGFRTSGESERPGFAWFFGRDALWTSFALNSYGDFAATRDALLFLKKFQRADGKIPHEISQSASLLPWFTDYPYPWASADATPLYVIAHADYWRATGDMEFLKANWDSIQKAYLFSAATDTDANHLIENTKVGHGWVEDGPLQPAHEEIYMQGLWIEASRSMAQMAEALHEPKLAQTFRAAAEETRAAMEQTYWLADKGYYSPTTRLPSTEAPTADPGPNRAVRQGRMEELAQARLVDEETVLPAVPLWWRTMKDERAQEQIDHLGGGRIAADWGARIISNESRLYDPLSYHNGSVWPLFTGWASMGAYAYGRAHVGYQALMANALLTYTSALGYVTELLSGDFNAPFGRSSHHQVWSEAMVVTPVMRGLLGIEVTNRGRELRFAPALPANWNKVEVMRVGCGDASYNLKLTRVQGRMSVTLTGNQTGSKLRFIASPSFPLDARVRRVFVGQREVKFETTRLGDAQRATVSVEVTQPSLEIVFIYDEGTDVYLERESLTRGAQSEGLRILRSRAEQGGLRLTLEGLGARIYALRLRSPYTPAGTNGLVVKTDAGADPEILVSFDGSINKYTRRELLIPLRRK